MMNSQKSSKEILILEKDPNNSGEKEHELIEFEENEHTEADSGIHQYMNYSNNEFKIKKEKKFKTFVEKPIEKNFLNGGDYSDFFNTFNADEDFSQNSNNKKFKTVTITKQNSISSQLRGILQASSKERDDDSKKIKF